MIVILCENFVDSIFMPRYCHSYEWKSEFCGKLAVRMRILRKITYRGRCCFYIVSLNVLEVKSGSCHGCGGPWDPLQALMLNPEDELLELYKSRLAIEKSQKKSKKVKTAITTSGEAGQFFYICLVYFFFSSR